MDNNAEAPRRLQQILALPDDERTRLLLDEATVVTVGKLTRALESDPENLDLRHTLGWWHEFVSSMVATEEERDEHRAHAFTLLLPIYRVSPDHVPNRMHASLVSFAERMDAFVAEHLPRIWNGTCTASLDEVIEAAKTAVFHTPRNHANRAGRLSSLGITLQTRFRRTGDLDDLNNAITIGHEAIDATPTNHPNRAGRLSEPPQVLCRFYAGRVSRVRDS